MLKTRTTLQRTDLNQRPDVALTLCQLSCYIGPYRHWQSSVKPAFSRAAAASRPAHKTDGCVHRCFEFRWSTSALSTSTASCAACRSHKPFESNECNALRSRFLIVKPASLTYSDVKFHDFLAWNIVVKYFWNISQKNSRWTKGAGCIIHCNK